MTEQDLIDRIIEYLNDGYENMEYAKCLFFTWTEFFNDDSDSVKTDNVLNEICDSVADIDTDEVMAELMSVCEN